VQGALLAWLHRHGTLSKDAVGTLTRPGLAGGPDLRRGRRRDHGVRAGAEPPVARN